MMNPDQNLYFVGKNEADKDRMWVDVNHENFSILGWDCVMSKETLPPHSDLNEVNVVIVIFKL